MGPGGGGERWDRGDRSQRHSARAKRGTTSSEQPGTAQADPCPGSQPARCPSDEDHLTHQAARCQPHAGESHPATLGDTHLPFLPSPVQVLTCCGTRFDDPKPKTGGTNLIPLMSSQGQVLHPPQLWQLLPVPLLVPPHCMVGTAFGMVCCSLWGHGSCSRGGTLQGGSGIPFRHCFTSTPFETSPAHPDMCYADVTALERDATGYASSA